MVHNLCVYIVYMIVQDFSIYLRHLIPAEYLCLIPIINVHFPISANLHRNAVYRLRSSLFCPRSLASVSLQVDDSPGWTVRGAALTRRPQNYSELFTISIPDISRSAKESLARYSRDIMTGR